MDNIIMFAMATLLIGSIGNALAAAYQLSHPKRPEVPLSADFFLGKTLIIQVKTHVGNQHSWFKHHPGEVFEVKPIRNGYMLAQDIGPEIRCINASDCKVVAKELV